MNDFRKIRNRKIRKFSTAIMKDYIEKTKIEEGFNGALMYDPLTIYYLMNPFSCRSVSMNLSVKTNKDKSGKVYIKNISPKTKVIFNIKKNRFKRDFINILSKKQTLANKSVSIKILKIAKGNTTALIYNCPRKIKKKILKLSLKKAEQVGFVEVFNQIPRLTMMGDELCINATMALAAQFSKKGKIYSSGIKDLIEYKNEKTKTTIKILMKYKKEKNLILFEGIGFICIPKNKKQTIVKSFLRDLCNKYSLPAFGTIIYENNKIIPYVYVKKANTFVKETACGSGSIAYSIFSGRKRIVQPTGEVIYVKIGKRIEVSAKITKETLLNLNSIKLK